MSMVDKVLVVDDEEDICVFMDDMISRKGFKVFTALSGEDALDIYEKHRPQAAIIDVHMPFSKFDGIELIRRMKAIDDSVHCVIISRVEDASAKEEAADKMLIEIKANKLEEEEELKINYIGRLIEYSQKYNLPHPVYVEDGAVLQKESNKFRIGCRFVSDKGIYKEIGVGLNKKEAKQKVSKKVYDKLFL